MRQYVVFIAIMLSLAYITMTVEAEELSLYEYNGEAYGLMTDVVEGVEFKTVYIEYDLRKSNTLTMVYQIEATNEGIYSFILPFSLGQHENHGLDQSPKITVDDIIVDTTIIAIGSYDEDLRREKALEDNGAVIDKVHAAFQGDYVILNSESDSEDYNIRGQMFEVYMEDNSTKTITIQKTANVYSTAEITKGWIERYQLYFCEDETRTSETKYRISVIPNWTYEFGKPYLVESNTDFVLDNEIYLWEGHEMASEGLVFSMYDEREVQYTRLGSDGKPISKSQDQAVLWIVAFGVIAIFGILLIAIAVAIMVIIIRKLKRKSQTKI